MMDAGSELSIPWGGTTLSFRVVRSTRETLRITVSPDGAVCALVPERATDEEIRARVSRRAGWISRQIDRFSTWRPRTPPRQYVSGETHLYLGKQLRLHVRESDQNFVMVDGNRLIVDIWPSADFHARRALIRHWHKLQADRVFPERLQAAFPPFDRLGISYPRLVIRPLSRRWGSFTPKQSLVLNQDLIQASPHLIDYVITHELCHAVHANHGESWQRLMVLMLPDWSERKAALERELL